MIRYWIIRHSDLTFSRPIPEPILISKIESGQLDRRDEICASGQYWFSIQEVEEVRKFFGDIRLNAALPAAEDGTTSPAIHTRADSTQPIQPSPVVEENPVEERHTATVKKSSSIPKNSQKNSIEPLTGLPAQEMDLEEESPVSSRIVLVLVLLFIFLGTIYLIWVGSH